MGKSILKVDPVAYDDVDLDADFDGFLEEDDDFEWDQEDLGDDDFSIDDFEISDDDDLDDHDEDD